MGKTSTIWYVEYTDPGRDTDRVAFVKKEDAYKAAAEYVYRLAKEDLENYEFEEDDPVLEMLRDVINEFENNSFERAFEAWDVYAGEVSSDYHVLVESIDLVK